MSGEVRHFYDFGPFRLDVTEHLLVRAGKAVALTPKAFDTLLMLVRNGGRIVEKYELLKSIWPETLRKIPKLQLGMDHLKKHLRQSNRHLMKTINSLILQNQMISKLYR